MLKRSKGPTVRMPTVEEDKSIKAAAKTDVDAGPLTQKQLKAMVPARGRPNQPRRAQ